MRSSKPATTWRRFALSLLGSFVGGLAMLYGAILIIDPYDVLPFSPNWQRFPVSRHARDYNAVLARRPQYDSAVIGNSTAMLLPPRALNRALGGRFVMLAMPAASPYEQRLLLALFLRHHAAPSTLLIGLDASWCHAQGAPRFQGLMRDHPFPDWLYDENPWNDLPPLNVQTFKVARRQFQALIGWRIRYPHKPDGYWDFTDALYERNDPQAVHERLYSGHRRLLKLGPDGAPPRFPDLNALETLLHRAPKQTRKILFFAPAHYLQIPAADTEQGQAWQQCKARAGALADGLSHALVVDFHRISSLTRTDANFIDDQHYVRSVALQLIQYLAQAWAGKDAGEVWRVLGRS